MAKEHVLVVEDEVDIRKLVEYNLDRAGFRVTVVGTGELAINEARSRPPDLVLLDLMLPGLDGLEVCRALRADSRTAHVPIIMLTARGEEADIVAGLELGADDYMTKPFSPRVLVSRIRTVLRRRQVAQPDAETVIQIRDLVIHPGRHEVRFKGKTLDLTPTEFRVLRTLAARPGWVFTRDQIVAAVQGPDYPVTNRSVDVQIVAVRRKLGPAGKLIETVRSIGYRFTD